MVDHGALAAVPDDPARAGYGFTGWFTDAEATTPYLFDTPVSAALTLYAGWAEGVIDPDVPVGSCGSNNTS